MTTVNKIVIVRIHFGSKPDIDFLKKQYALICSYVFNTENNEKNIEIIDFKITRNNENNIITADILDVWDNIESQLNEYEYIYFDFIPPIKSVIPPALEVRLCILISTYISEVREKDILVAVQNNEFSASYYNLSQIFRFSLEQGTIGIYQNNKLIIESKGKFDSYILNKKTDETEVALVKLKQKLIRRIGYYPRENTDDLKIDKEFYDGSECQDELSILLGNYIKKESVNYKKIVVLYYCSVSKWLIEPVRSMVVHMDPDTHTQVFPLDDVKNLSSKINNADKVFIIYPLIQSLRTLKKHLDKLSIDCNLSINEEKFRVKTILYAGINSPIKAGSNLTKVKVSGEEIEFDYFLKVKKEYYKESSWEKDFLINEYKSHDSIFNARTNHAELSSIDYWHLVKRTSFKPEKNVPRDVRNGLGNIPDLDGIFSSYGAWLCQKVIEQLKFALKDDGFVFKNYLIITPDEHNVNIITSYLKEFSDFDLIRVNRDYICGKQDIKEDIELCEKIRFCDPEVIILDDFTRSGSTLANLKKLMESFEKTIIKSLVLFEYASKTLSIEEDYLSLYQINIPENIEL